MARRIDPERLRDFVKYDPDTGGFTRARSWYQVKQGDIVGSRHSRGYLEASIGGARLFLHQAAWLYMTGEWPTAQIDHINGNREDNRWVNLRAATQRENSANMRRRSRNKVGLKGVVKGPKGKFLAFIHVNGKTKYLGTYLTADDAHAAYCKEASLVWGPFARAA